MLGRVGRVVSLWALFLMMVSVWGCKSKKEEVQEEGYLGEEEISDELPVSRVALYQNGVGYFERRGRVEGDELTLRIRPDQINDLLKSLTVIDLQGGHPVSISLPVDRQAIDQLAAIPTQIRDDGGVLALLYAFRGARVHIEADRVIEGRVVGIEEMDGVDDNGNRVERYKVSVKEESGELKIVDVDAINSLKIMDRTLEVGLDKSLDISLNEGSWKPIELKVRMSDTKAKDVLVSYIVSMPVWKPAYRLVLGEKDEGIFQGWAVVDNVSGSDWERVRMSLIAGTPMSFIYDLYTPHFVGRPDLTARGQHNFAQAPVITESATAAVMDEMPEYEKKADLKRKSKSKPKRARRETTSKGSGSGGSYGNYGLAGEVYEEEEADPGYLFEDDARIDVAMAADNFNAATEGSEVSALFEYAIDSPVTVPDRSSALVNLVQAEGTAREIALFRPELWQDVVGLHPYRAVELHNASGFDLEPGPITLYKDGTFIGEGFLARTEKDAVAFVTFASDPQISLKTTRSETEEAAKITKIYGGYIESEIKKLTTVTYEVENKRSEAIRAVVRRPIRATWKLEPEPEGLLKAAGSYYIPIEVGPGETQSLSIKETTPVTRTLTLDSSLTIDLLQVHIKTGAMDEALKAQLEEVVSKQKELWEIREELSSLRERKRELENESWRITSSLEDIKDIKEDSAKALRKQLIERASEIEKSSGEMATKIAELSLKESDIERTLRALFGSITFEDKKAEEPKEEQ